MKYNRHPLLDYSVSAGEWASRMRSTATRQVLDPHSLADKISVKQGMDKSASVKETR